MPPVAVGKPHAKDDFNRVWGLLASEALAMSERIKDSKAYLDTLTLTDLQDASIGFTASQAQELKDAAAELATFATTTALVATRRIAGPSTLLL